MFMCAAAVTTAFTACSKTDDGDGQEPTTQEDVTVEGNVTEYNQTYYKFTLTKGAFVSDMTGKVTYTIGDNTKVHTLGSVAGTVLKIDDDGALVYNFAPGLSSQKNVYKFTFDKSSFTDAAIVTADDIEFSFGIVPVK